MTEPRSRFRTPLRFRGLLLLAALAVLSLGSALGLAQEEASDEVPPVLQLVQERPELSTFAELLSYGNLASELEEDLRLTLLAPNDAAFERMPEDVEATLRRNPGALNYVLRNHLFVGAAPTSAMRHMDAISTLLPSRLPVRVQNDQLRIAGARIVQGNLEVRNGYVHVIDTVLVPRSAFPSRNALNRP